MSGEVSRPGAGLLEVYDRALPQVYGYLISRCGQRSVAEDLTSETFLAAARQSSNGPVSVGWLIGVARHKLADHWRRQAREERLVRAVGSSTDQSEDPFEAHLDVVREGNQADRVVPQVGLWPGDAWREGVTPGAILSWRVDDVETAVARVRGAGGSANDPEQLPYGLQSECTDGQGLRFWLHELPPPGEPAGPNGDREGDISYVVLRVGDLGRARTFFSDVLGWTFSPGNVGVHVAESAPMTGVSEGAPGVTLCFRVEDIEAAVARVRDAGGTAEEPQPRPYGVESACADDQGVEFYLHRLS